MKKTPIYYGIALSGWIAVNWCINIRFGYNPADSSLHFVPEWRGRRSKRRGSNQWRLRRHCLLPPTMPHKPSLRFFGFGTEPPKAVSSPKVISSSCFHHYHIRKKTQIKLRESKFRLVRIIIHSCIRGKKEVSIFWNVWNYATSGILNCKFYAVQSENAPNHRR